LKLEDLKYTYELKDDFSVFPTFATCLHRANVFEALVSNPGMPKFNAMQLLHGEHKLELFNPIKPNAKLSTIGKIGNVADKGKGALITFDLSTFDVTEGKKELLFVNSLSLFVRGLGGFGYKGKPSNALPEIPKRSADKTLEDKTFSG